MSVSHTCTHTHKKKQAWAVGDFVVHQHGTYKASCKGVHTFSIDQVGQPWLSGDIYRLNILWSPVILAPGVHTIYARVRAKIQTKLQCEIQYVGTPASSGYALRTDSDKDQTGLGKRIAVFPQQFVPDIVNGAFAGEGLVAIPIQNLDAREWMRGVSASLSKPGKPLVRVVHASAKEHANAREIGVENSAGKDAIGANIDIAPGQLIALHVYLEVAQDSDSGMSVQFSCPTPFKIAISGSLRGETFTYETTVRVRCREKENQSFMMSFIDHDGSANQAAVVPPLEGCRQGQRPSGQTIPEEKCPVLLTMHGTGVPANDQVIPASCE
jgi:hypothetical protein